MFNENLYILLLFSLCYATIEMGPKTFDNYGPYNLTIPHKEMCKGPKSNTVAYCDMVIDNSNSQLAVNITYFQQFTSVDEMKITVFTYKDNQKRVLWNYRVSRPCQHFIFGSTIENYMKSKNCVVRKGSYDFVIDYLDYSRTFFGSSFFYGEYEIKSLVLSSKGNILCVVMNFVFSKMK